MGFFKKLKGGFFEMKAELNPKVRLVAIAKDESAYLPFWVYHHLRFGFTDIEIYVNNSTDNSLEVLKRIKDNYPVNVVKADYMFNDPECVYFQKFAYKIAHRKALDESIDYLLFLDIDEFWTPNDFCSSIQSCISELNQPDVISFEWVLKRNENACFSPPYSFTNAVSKNHHVKSLFKVNLDIVEINIHNISAEKAKNVLADGSIHPHSYPHPHSHCVDDYNINYTPIKKYFVLHRLWRSQFEYARMLGQGYMQVSHGNKDTNAVDFKLNRDGYLLPNNRITTIDFYKDLIDEYNEGYESFIRHNKIEKELAKARMFVVEQFHETIANIEKHKRDNVKLQNALKCLDINEAKKQALNIQSNCQDGDRFYS